MSTTSKPAPVSAAEALKCLEEAWAYFTCKARDLILRTPQRARL